MSVEQSSTATPKTQAANFAERALLAALILDPTRVPDVSETLRPEHFSTERGKYLYTLLLELSGKGEIFDLSVVMGEIRTRGKLEFMGGASTMLSLVQEVTTSQHAVYHAGIVRAAGMKRQISAMLTEGVSVVAQLEAKPEPVDRFLADMQDSLVKLDTHTNTQDVARSWIDAGTVVAEMCQPREQRACGIKTGWHDLDDLITGLAPGQLVVVGARPRMGKTALAGSLLAELGPANPGKTMLMFSMEMTSGEIMQRLLCARSKVSLHEVRSRGATKQEAEALEAAAQDLHHSSIIVRDSAGITLPQIVQYSRQVQFRHGLSLVVIDYLQLIRGDPKRNRHEVVAEVSRGLKEMAKKLQVPVLALAQLNRNAEGSDRPSMADLRESGAIEQDADTLWLLHRPEVYKPQDTNLKGQAELIVEKQRNGPTGTVHLRYLSGPMCFVNRTPTMEQPFG